MRNFYEWLLDEKIVLCGMTVFCSIMVLLLFHWHAPDAIIGIFGGGITGLIGALLRGITHQNPSTDSTQAVSSTTTVKPK